MHTAEIPFGGGVSRRFTRRPKGQSTVEYVLIIAIIVLVVLIAGPWVSSVIRNQFNLMAGAIGSGTTGENFYEPEDIPDPENGTAFAVYSEDDHSLMFYKRRGVPNVGDMFNYRRVTAVYTGFETESYGALNSGDFDNDATTPWFNHADDCLCVTIVDEGIHPNDLGYWFQHFKNCSSFNLSKLQTSYVSRFTHLFFNCRQVASLDLSSWDLSNTTSTVSIFGHCSSLEHVDLGILPFDKIQNLEWMFGNCPQLILDCSNWNVSKITKHNDFNTGSPNVILPKAWQ